ncbi:hypothetical protein C0992_000613, partial [Termitomyces sp. T32_za158]
MAVELKSGEFNDESHPEALEYQTKALEVSLDPELHADLPNPGSTDLGHLVPDLHTESSDTSYSTEAEDPKPVISANPPDIPHLDTTNVHAPSSRFLNDT